MAVVTGPSRHLPRRHFVVVVAAVVGVLGLALLGAALALVRTGGGDGGSSAAGTAQGSGSSVTQVRDVPSFSAVTLSGTTSVHVTVGPPRAVRVTADDNLVGRVSTRVRHGTLDVGTHGSFRTRSPMTVEVTVAALRAVRLAGTGTVVVTGVDAHDLVVALPGTGTLRVAGRADRLQVSLAGSGSVALRDLVARDVVATLSGVGDVVVRATRDLHATVSGTGSIRYVGHPASVVQEVTGTGSVTAE